jgi:hypothetical protein
MTEKPALAPNAARERPEAPADAVAVKGRRQSDGKPLTCSAQEILAKSQRMVLRANNLWRYEKACLITPDEP